MSDGALLARTGELAALLLLLTGVLRRRPAVLPGERGSSLDGWEEW